MQFVTTFLNNTNLVVNESVVGEVVEQNVARVDDDSVETTMNYRRIVNMRRSSPLSCRLSSPWPELRSTGPLPGS